MVFQNHVQKPVEGQHSTAQLFDASVQRLPVEKHRRMIGVRDGVRYDTELALVLRDRCLDQTRECLSLGGTG